MAAVRMADLPATGTDVLVVGAGPTGLMAALVLTRRSVPVVVVDQKEGPTRESRALAVQARTMEIYDQLGLAGQVLTGAYPALRMQVGTGPPLGGVSIADLQQGDTRFPGIQIFEQSATEQLLSRSLAAAGTDVLWRHRLIDLIDDAGQADGQVVALLDGPAGLVRVRARWCIGADGARSAVRRELDIPFEGVTDDASFWVADLRGVRGLPDKSMAARFGDATFAVAFPLGPAGHTRLVALAPRDDIGQEEALAAARADLALAYDGVDWFSSYRVHHRVATAFRKGSVFLAGDAGHVHSPVGGQGMNTGLQDAHNLALLLADVRQERLNTAALDRYEQERRPVAVMLVKVTDRLFGFIGLAKPADCAIAAPGERNRRASRAPAAEHPVRQAHRRLPGPIPDPLPLRRQERPHARLGGRPGRGPAAAAGARQSPTAAHAGLAGAHLRHPGRAA